MYVRETHECGRSRTASARRTVRRVKKPLCNSDDRCRRQKQGGAVGAAASRVRVPPKARCSRWEPRPGHIVLRGSRNPPAPTKRSSIRTGCWIFCFVETFSGLSGRIRIASARRTVRRAKKPQCFFRCAARDIHPCPPRDPVSEPGTGFSVLWKLFQGRVGRRQM